MKTTRFTKILLMSAGALLIAGTMQAQDQIQADPTGNAKALDDNAVSLITNGMGSSKGKGGFWGYAFGDYAYMGAGDSAGRGTKQQYKGLGQPGQNSGQNAFEIRRAYLGYDYNPNKRLTGCVLLAYEGDQDVNDNRTMYMKYAYIKIKNIWKGTDLRIGQEATNSFADAYNTEPLLGYRSIEKTIMDIHGMDGSSDMGIYLGGKIYTFKSADSTKFPAFIGYSAMIGNNSGNNPVPGFTNAIATTLGGLNTTKSGAIVLNDFNYTTDNAKKFRGHLFVNALNGMLTVGGYADYINYGNFYYNGTAKGYQHATMTTKAYASFNQKWFGIGVEWVAQTFKNGEIETTYGTPKTTTDTVDGGQSGLSIFAYGNIIQNCLSVFVRYDMFNPDTKYSYTYNANSTLANKANETFTTMASNIGKGGNTYTETFINAGVDYSPFKDKKLHIMPNLWMYQIKNGFGSDNLASATYMFYRVTFLFAF